MEPTFQDLHESISSKRNILFLSEPEIKYALKSPIGNALANKSTNPENEKKKLRKDLIEGIDFIKIKIPNKTKSDSSQLNSNENIVNLYQSQKRYNRKIECEICGSVVSASNMPKHKLSKKHIFYREANIKLRTLFIGAK